MAEPTSAPKEVWKFFCTARIRGPSHVGEQPELTGSLGLLAVWVLVFWLLAMAVFTANV